MNRKAKGNTEELYRYYLVLAEYGNGLYTEQICNLYETNGFHLTKYWIAGTYF